MGVTPPLATGLGVQGGVTNGSLLLGSFGGSRHGVAGGGSNNGGIVGTGQPGSRGERNSLQPHDIEVAVQLTSMVGKFDSSTDAEGLCSTGVQAWFEKL